MTPEQGTEIMQTFDAFFKTVLNKACFFHKEMEYPIRIEILVDK